MLPSPPSRPRTRVCPACIPGVWRILAVAVVVVAVVGDCGGSIGKVDDASAISRKNHHQQVTTKIERRNKARQLQLTKRKDNETDARIFKGKDAAPRVVAVVPLCADVSAAATVRALLKSLNIGFEVPQAGVFTIWYVVGDGGGAG